MENLSFSRYNGAGFFIYFPAKAFINIRSEGISCYFHIRILVHPAIYLGEENAGPQVNADRHFLFRKAKFN